MNKKLNRQLALPLEFRSIKDYNNFILNKANEIALHIIDEFNDLNNFIKKYNFPILILYGPTGSGKTHLAHIYKQITNARFINKITNENLKETKLGKSFIIDNFDKIENLNENFFLQFFNEISFNLGSLLIITSKPPKELKFILPDLESRIKSCICVKIDLPDDDFLYSMLIKELDDKKLFLNDKLCFFVIKRIRRSYKSISIFAKKLDMISLEEKKAITLSQVKKALDLTNIIF